MCLAIPGKLIEITDSLDEVFRLGKVSFDGILKEVNLALVPEAVLQWARDDARRMNSAGMALDDIVAAMVAGYRAGQRVVRLHTGDPSLYGAIFEQMVRLEEAGVPIAFTGSTQGGKGSKIYNWDFSAGGGTPAPALLSQTPRPDDPCCCAVPTISCCCRSTRCSSPLVRWWAGSRAPT